MTLFPRDFETIGDELHDLAARLFPICRSISGDGVRETLTILREIIPLEVGDVPTGTEVFDWVVPPEWNIRDAYVATENGNRVIDFQRCNLHVVNGSRPVRTKLTWSRLKPRLHTLPKQPGLIPYRTCFFEDDWGFCLSQNDFDALDAAEEQEYEIVIDSRIEDGSLTYGELFLPGKTKDEILFSAHICHPSLANDNLSGACVAAWLANHLIQIDDRRYSYRFLFAPATIGAITWLALNRDRLDRIKHGLVLSLLGDPGQSTYKRSRDGNAEIDRIAEHVLTTSGKPYEVREFTPYGYDERQFCSPGINLAMGCLMRTPNGEFPQYHTSADNLDFIKPAHLEDSLEKCLRIVEIFENNRHYVNRFPNCEPRLGKHGLYQGFSDDAGGLPLQQAVQWVLNLSDGGHSLLDIAERSKLEFAMLHKAAERLLDCGLIAGRWPSEPND